MIIICYHTDIWFQVFLSNTNNSMILSDDSYLILIIGLHIGYMVSSIPI